MAEIKEVGKIGDPNQNAFCITYYKAYYPKEAVSPILSDLKAFLEGKQDLQIKLQIKEGGLEFSNSNDSTMISTKTLDCLVITPQTENPSPIYEIHRYNLYVRSFKKFRNFLYEKHTPQQRPAPR